MTSTPTVFVTGVTGYIGGDALAAIYGAHPEWQYRFLVRSAKRGAPAAAQFAGSELVVGDITDVGLLEAEGGKADIIMHFASSSDEASVTALLAGAAARFSSTGRPAYFVHTSGAGCLQFEDQAAGTYGEERDRVWDDVRDIAALKTLPPGTVNESAHRLIFAATAPGVRCAIVAPPAVVGTGRGPVNQRSVQVPVLAELTLGRGRGFTVGRGRARWSFTHVADLSAVYLALVEDAARGGQKEAVWGGDGFFLVENGEREWGAVARRVTRKLHEARPAQVPDPDAVDELTPDQAHAVMPIAKDVWGANSRCKATRAREVLGWKPEYDDFDAQIDEAVRYDLEVAKLTRLQEFAQGHAPMLPAKFSELTKQ